MNLSDLASWFFRLDQEWKVLSTHVRINIMSENKSIPILIQPSMPNILLRVSLLLKKRHSLINSFSMRGKREIRRHSGWDHFPGLCREEDLVRVLS
jgi:hypothetical protein